MAGVVYLKTNNFEVKLEGITFKAKDFGRLCSEDFLFPEGRIWAQPPIVGIDVVRHPRDPSILLVMLCFGLGCVILRFHSGAALPEPIHRFITDKRIRFVGFGNPEKSDLFPFEELGLVKEKSDIGYLAAKTFDNPKYIKSDLGVLARRVLGIKRMFGLTHVSCFERHDQIKATVCQLFITSLIAMSLLSKGEKIKVEECSNKKSSFLKNFLSLPLLTEGWLKLPKGGRKEEKVDDNNLGLQTTENDHMKSGDDSFNSRGGQEYVFFDDDDDAWKRGREVSLDENDDCSKEAICRKHLKGILKCPSSNMEVGCPVSEDGSSSTPSTPKVESRGEGPYRRANSKGHNVSFKLY